MVSGKPVATREMWESAASTARPAAEPLVSAAMPAAEAGPSAPIHVLKLGGRSLDSGDAVHQMAREAAAFPGRLVFVHGGGAEVSAWSRRLGIEPEFVNGLRVTDSGTLDVAVAVLAGLANKRLVATLRRAGVNAVGIAGLDGGLVEVAPAADRRLGAVGRIVSVAARLLHTLLASGFTPVVASIACLDGHLMNVNADDVAAALAPALGATSLTLLSDVSGLHLKGRHVANLTDHELRAALDNPEVTGGMLPKLQAACIALSGGVSRVHIGTWAGEGTLASLRQGFPTATTCRRGVADE